LLTTFNNKAGVVNRIGAQIERVPFGLATPSPARANPIYSIRKAEFLWFISLEAVAKQSRANVGGFVKSAW
jgi:hypothetical protein